MHFHALQPDPPASSAAMNLGTILFENTTNQAAFGVLSGNTRVNL
jgi:hypothetical protein